MDYKSRFLARFTLLIFLGIVFFVYFCTKFFWSRLYDSVDENLGCLGLGLFLSDQTRSLKILMIFRMFV